MTTALIEAARAEALRLAEELQHIDNAGICEASAILDSAAMLRVLAAAEAQPNLACKSVQARLAEQWGYVKAQPADEPHIDGYPLWSGLPPAEPVAPHAEIARLHAEAERLKDKLSRGDIETARAVAEDRRRILGLLEELRDANCAAQGVEHFQLLTPRQEAAWGALRSALTGRNMTHDQAALNSPAAEILALKDLLREATVALLWPGPPSQEFIDRLNAAIDGPNVLVTGDQRP